MIFSNPLINKLRIWETYVETVYAIIEIMARIFKQIFTLFLSLTISVINSYAGKEDFVHNFTPREYGGALQNWSVVQGEQGVVYVGNNGAVLEYDGANWSYITIPNGSIVRSMDINSSGQIFIGTDDDFGYLESDQVGNKVFVSLRSLISHEVKLSSVWKTICLKDGVVFYTTTMLYFYSNKEMKQFPLKEGSMAQHIDGKVILHDQKNGFSFFDGMGIQSLDCGQDISPAVFSILPYESNKWLIGTSNDGLLIWEPKLIDANNQNKIYPLKGEANDWLKKMTIYNGSKFHNSFIFGTIKGGAVQVNKNGEIERIFDHSAGLQDKTVYGHTIDEQNGLWLCLSKGITRIELSSPFEQFNEDDGLEGVVMSMVQNDQGTYFGTFSGIYRMDENNRFIKVKGSDGICWQLEVVEGEIVAASEKGVLHVKGDQVNLLSKFSSYSLFALGNILWVGLKNGLTAFQVEDGVFTTNNQEMSLGANVLSIVTRNNFEIWLGTRKNGVLKLDLTSNQITSFDASNGLLSPSGNKVKMFGGHLKVASKQGVLSLDVDNNLLYYDTAYNNQLATEGRYVYQLEKGNKDEYFYSTLEGNKNRYNYVTTSNKTYKVDAHTFQRLPSMDVRMIELDEAHIWIGGSLGVFRYQKENYLDLNRKFSALIRSVVIGHDSTLFAGGDYRSSSDSMVAESNVAYDHNNFAFNFSSSSFDNSAGNLFQYRLIGFEEEWSEWTSNTTKEYTNVAEGAYTFQLRTKNTYDKISSISSYTFHVLPPWYRTWWAYGLYILMIGGLLFVGIKINQRRLMNENKRLEGIVQARTQEVVAQKDEIEKKAERIAIQAEEINIKNEVLNQVNEEITEKNKQITDSIEYAQKIQDAALSTEKILEKEFNEHFILFKPRDIVSGDFYWMHENEDLVFWAAADCTGHGVPGAFMSMIGISLLNEIVVEKGIYSPDEILTQLRALIITLLDNGEGTNKDGMDIGLCVMNKQTKELEFAGAYNPCYIYRGEEFIELAADSMPVGRHKKEHVPFTKQSYQLEENDNIYVFSDGYVDQFGGKKGVKFMSKRFKKMLMDFQSSSMEDQKAKYDEVFTKWRGRNMQLDDVVVIGVKV